VFSASLYRKLRVSATAAFAVIVLSVLVQVLNLASAVTDLDEARLLHQRAVAVDMAVHRGLRSTFRGTVPDEDSVRACLSAMSSGADSCEVDVRVSLDGVPILMHDRTTKRITRGRGCDLVVALSTYRQLAHCRLVHGDKIARLSDLARAMRPYAAHHSLIVELKASMFTTAELLRVNGDLARYGFAGTRSNLDYESFIRSNLIRMKQISPATQELLISHRAPDADTVAGADGLNGLILPYGSLVSAMEADPSYVDEFRDAGMQVMPWKVNNPMELRYVLAADVSGVLTDDAGTLRAALNLRRH
jgi:glycerophosphoryl diester phosphodiesterase